MENAWLIPLFPLLSFLILLLFGKRLKEASAYVGILAHVSFACLFVFGVVRALFRADLYTSKLIGSR